MVIAGAGIMGITTAYYLARDFGVRCTLIDPTGSIAPAASGKAGGFLAKDWNDYTSTGPLTRRSFQLHQDLADQLGPESIQYRRLTCAGITVNEKTENTPRRPRGKKLEGIEWADEDGADTATGVRILGDETTIAQVHPKLLCERLFQETQRLLPATRLLQGTVLSASSSSEDGAILHDGTAIDCDALLYACGPWSCTAMSGVKYHSVVVPTPTILSQCVFFSGCGDPEVYVRPDHTAYCTGFPDPPVQPVTEQPGHESIREEAIVQIQTAVQQATASHTLFPAPVLSSASAASSSVATTTTTTQACYLPATPDGLPFMGKILPHNTTSTRTRTTSTTPIPCYVNAGHSCWGILLGPASGEAMAQFIVTGTSSHVKLHDFDPARMGPTMDMVPRPPSPLAS